MHQVSLRRVRIVLCALAVCSLSAFVLPATGVAQATTPWPGGTWTPPAATYGMQVMTGVSVTMDDGVVLHARVGYPTDLGTGQRAPGTFPVLLTQNPYAGGENPDVFYVSRGYIHVVAEVRGTGVSELSASDPNGLLAATNFAQRDGLDGAALVDYVAHDLDGSNGIVGLNGCSWLGINQFITAAEVGPNSPLKAMVPACANNNYQTYLYGGVPTAVVNLFGSPSTMTGVKHAPENQAVGVFRRDSMLSGGDLAYDREYWQERTSSNLVERIVDNGVPALMYTGWNALEGSTGAIDLYAQFQNALANRPTFQPQDPNAPSSGRYQIVVTPGGHGQFIDKTLQLEWYDTWLKGVNTGMDKTDTGMHLFENGANRWFNSASWPVTDDYTPLYLGAGNTLTDTPGAAHSESVTFAPATDPLSTVIYDSQPYGVDQTIAGPIGATLWVSSSTTNAHVITTLLDVAPGGATTEISSGSLIASMRELDSAKSWYDADGLAIKPEGRFTGDSYLTPNQVYRLDVEIIPTVRRLAAGHSLRLVVQTQNPTAKCSGAAGLTRPNACIFTATQAPTLAGGTYQIVSGPDTPSSVNVPLVPSDSLTTILSGTTPTSPTQTQPLDWGSLDRDRDDDAVVDDVDADGGTGASAAGAFDDHSGTSGQLTDAGGLSVEVSDAPAPDGVHVVTGTGPSGARATVTACNGFTVHVAPDSDVVVSCASLIVRAVQGSAEVELSDDVAVSVPAGVSAEITDLGAGRFSVDVLPGSSGPATVTAFGFPTVIGADDAPFIVSLVAPPDTLIVIGPAEGSATRSTNARLKFASTGASATFECAFDGGAWSPCTSPVHLDDLADGTHTFAVRSIAQAVTDPTPSTRTWTVDRVDPVIDVAVPVDGGAYPVGSTVASAFSCDDPGGSGVVACTGPLTVDTSSRGRSSFVVEAVDAAGNRARVRIRYEVVEPPDTKLQRGPKDGDALAATTASFRVSSPGEPDATFECSLDGAGWSPCPPVVELSGLADGAHSFAARAVANGLVDATPATRSWTVDTAGPSIVVTSPAEGAVYAKRQVVVPSFACTDPGGSGVKKCNGPAKVDTQSAGAKVFVVKATDEAGNDSATTIHYAVAS